MIALVRNPDVLAEVVARVLDAGAAKFELEYEDGKEHVVAFNEAVGVGSQPFPQIRRMRRSCAASCML